MKKITALLIIITLALFCASYSYALRPAATGEAFDKMPRPIKTILVMDDEEAPRAYWSKMLEQAGIRVVTAVNMVDGLNILQKEPFDAIITDIEIKLSTTDKKVSSAEGLVFAVKARLMGFKGPIALYSGLGPKNSGVENLIKNSIVNFALLKTDVAQKGYVERFIEELKYVNVILPKEEILEEYKKAIDDKDTGFFMAESPIKTLINARNKYILIQDEDSTRHDINNQLMGLFGSIQLWQLMLGDNSDMRLEVLYSLTIRAVDLNKSLLNDFSKRVSNIQQAAKDAQSILDILEGEQGFIPVILHVQEQSAYLEAETDKQGEYLKTIKHSCAKMLELANQYLAYLKPQLKIWQKELTTPTGGLNISDKILIRLQSAA
ncbi:MAG: response regulator [Candidatus Omnitrophota bacterium]